MIAGCYRRDEAQNPDAFISALTLVLSDYSERVIDYATDPRTGVPFEFPNGLPNVGQVREMLERLEHRFWKATPKAKVEPEFPETEVAYQPNPIPNGPNIVTWPQFEQGVREGKYKQQVRSRNDKNSIEA